MARRSTPVLDVALANHHVVRDVAAAVTQVVADRLGEAPTRIERQQIETDVATQIAADPVAVNNLSAEPLPNSRTFMGGVGATLGSIGTALTALAGMLGAFDGVASPGQPGFWLALIVFLTGGASGSGGALAVIGRLRDDLPPMKRHIWNPLSWLARSSA